MARKKHIEDAETKLHKIEQECRLLLKDCKMCAYYVKDSVTRCNDKECRMISAVAQAYDFLQIIDN